MYEIDFLSKIMNKKFVVDDDPLLMYEPADELHEAQIVEIEDKFNKLTGVHLYCFTDDDHKGINLFPFFNQASIRLPHAPKNLNKFCDYILLLTCDNVPYIFLLELKRGSTEDADEQIQASKVFMDYIISTAKRIKKDNDQLDFDSDNIRFRRLIIKKETSNKRITKPNELDPQTFNTCLLHKCTDKFNPICYCRGDL